MVYCDVHLCAWCCCCMLQQLSTALKDTSMIDGQSFLAPTHLQVGSSRGSRSSGGGAAAVVDCVFVVVNLLHGVGEGGWGGG